MGPPGGSPPAAPPSTESVLKVYKIQYASATEVARVVTEVYGSGAPAQQPGFFPGGPPPPPAGNKPVIKASAEDYSNSVIIYAPSAQQADIAQFIAQIDKASDQPQVPRVFKLQYAVAEDLASVIQGILDDSSPLGRGGETTAKQQQDRNRSPFFFFDQSSGSQNQNGTVIADSRTNSLVVTATIDNLDHIAEVLKELDQPAAFQSTTWVYVFKNARADVVANLLNQSFGNKTTNGPIGGSLTNTGLTQSSGSQVGQTNESGGTSTPTGFQTNPNQQSGFNQQGGGNPRQDNGSSGQNAPTTGLDSEGHVVNVRNLTGQVLLVPNIDTNSVIVVSPPEDRAIVEAILEEMDEIPKQVMIQTLVVEANLDKAHQLGIEFNGTQNNPFGGLHGTQTETQSYGLQANTTQPQGLRYTLSAGQYSVFLQAVQTDSRFNVLSTPRIFTTNNATAQINISQSLPYVTNQTVTTTGTILYNYNFLNVGIVLTVTPRITSNGYVTMDVTQTANDFVSYTSFNAPIVNQREAQTTVSVKDGETIVLGGIINNSVSRTVSKIPLLGDLPLIGNLFRSTSATNNKTELLVFLTPHVVRDPTEARSLRLQTEQELGRTTQQMIPPAPKPPEEKPNP
jgi:general secretion pathway protein D